jgi:TPR repeat protein
VRGCIAKCQDEADAKSCNLVGAMFEFDAGGRDDPSAASAFYRRACDSSYYPGCNNLAWLYLGGRGVPRDQPRAMRLFHYAFEAAKTACTMGDTSGCMMAGEFLYEGRGVEKDDAAAVVLLDRACAGGERRGCAMATLLR